MRKNFNLFIIKYNADSTFTIIKRGFRHPYESKPFTVNNHSA